MCKLELRDYLYVMEEQFIRTQMLYGEIGLARLRSAKVIVFGLGGVGGHVAEALARSGIGTQALVDHDRITLSNLNRQILALHSTLGQLKVDAAEERIHDIAPNCIVQKHALFVTPELIGQMDFRQYSYVVDAIDTVSAKLALAEAAQKSGVPIISCMGAGNKRLATALQVADLAQTAICPLARIMRKKLRHRGIEHLKVVYSREEPHEPEDCMEENEKGRPVPGSNAFVPAVAGLLIAGEVINALSSESEIQP